MYWADRMVRKCFYDNSGIWSEDLVPVKCISVRSGLGCFLFLGSGSVVVDSLLIVIPILVL